MNVLRLQMYPQEKVQDVVEKVVIVAVRASNEIPTAALRWALTHVVQARDYIKLLVVIPSPNSGKKLLWGLPRFPRDCTNAHHWSLSGTLLEQKIDITDSCSQVMLQLRDVYDPDKIKFKTKVVSGSPCGAVAAEAKRSQTNWVILDKRLKHEAKCCMQELQCNIVVMKHSQPKVLRLNLIGSPTVEPELGSPSPSGDPTKSHDLSDMIRGPFVTPASSPEHDTPFTATDIGTPSVSSSDPCASPFFISEISGFLKKGESSIIEKINSLNEMGFEIDSENLNSTGEFSENSIEDSLKSRDLLLLAKFSKLCQEVETDFFNSGLGLDTRTNVREVVSLSRKALPDSPPLCSICQHKAPEFGKPPRKFTYTELESATCGFSKSNFLAEGGYGSVHRGVLPDGQVIAVKQHKLASSQGDVEFCSEVEVLSCAQHRNVVMLIGFCVDNRRRLLVYEYICNGSLDSHLYGLNEDALKWPARQKVAVGAARGLRYLHEECRVGCIVHRDMRPNNILITHDFEPLVGDFGLARWQLDGDMGEETRVIGTFGYLAPEYAQTGQITEKADVYSFGVVLVELITGRKAVDFNQPKGQQCLTEWARPLLEENAVHKLVDPRLRGCYIEQEIYRMIHCASLCIRRDPHLRPRMSQVLRMLEGDTDVSLPITHHSHPSIDETSVNFLQKRKA